MGPGDSGGGANNVQYLCTIIYFHGDHEGVPQACKYSFPARSCKLLIIKSSNNNTFGTMKYMYQPLEQYKHAVTVTHTIMP